MRMALPVPSTDQSDLQQLLGEFLFVADNKPAHQTWQAFVTDVQSSEPARRLDDEWILRAAASLKREIGVEFVRGGDFQMARAYDSALAQGIGVPLDLHGRKRVPAHYVVVGPLATVLDALQRTAPYRRADRSLYEPGSFVMPGLSEAPLNRHQLRYVEPIVRIGDRVRELVGD